MLRSPTNLRNRCPDPSDDHGRPDKYLQRGPGDQRATTRPTGRIAPGDPSTILPRKVRLRATIRALPIKKSKPVFLEHPTHSLMTSDELKSSTTRQPALLMSTSHRTSSRLAACGSQVATLLNPCHSASLCSSSGISSCFAPLRLMHPQSSRKIMLSSLSCYLRQGMYHCYSTPYIDHLIGQTGHSGRSQQG